MSFRILLFTAVYLVSSVSCFSQWLNISNVKIKSGETELGGQIIEISYELNCDVLSEEMPAYFFIRFSKDDGHTWQLLNRHYIQGNGFGLVSRSGNKNVVWWGSKELGIKDIDLLKVQVRGIHMVRIPAGDFKMKGFPADGKDPSVGERPDTNLSEYYFAKNETTISMYVDYLNEVGKDGYGWNNRMTNSLRCGILSEGHPGEIHYTAIPGKENFPITYVSWYDAISFLDWCGLTLPTEAMWEKAYVGGYYLDGDETKQVENPVPDRKYPWGNEAPYEDNIFKCNFDKDRDGYEFMSPVGSYSEYASPYGVNDMAGNVAEWTLDWYSTNYHAGLDGFRMVRGGSWMAMPFACDAVSGATQFPIKESSIMGFRGVMRR